MFLGARAFLQLGTDGTIVSFEKALPTLKRDQDQPLSESEQLILLNDDAEGTAIPPMRVSQSKWVRRDIASHIC